MFAAAKIARVMSSEVLVKVLVFWEWKRGKQSSKKFSKKKYQNYCEVKKRVLYLHPLNEETS